MYLLGRLTRLIISFILLLLPGYYATNDDTCSFAELQSSRARLQAVKNDILLRLGLKEEPRNPASEEIPDFLEDYEAVKEAVKLNQKHIPCARLDIGTKERRAFSPTAVQRIRPLPRTAEGDECASNPLIDFFYLYKIRFQIDLRGKDFVTKADLRLKKSLLEQDFLRDDGIKVEQKDLVHIFYWVRGDGDNEDYPIYITSTYLDQESISGVVELNITKAILLWLDVPEHAQSRMGNIELELRLRCPEPLSSNDTFVPNFQFFTESSNESRLYITTYKERTHLQHNALKRKRRNSEDMTFCRPSEFQCCLNRLTINFERDLNWTWIIRPKEIPFNFCSGECPLYLENQHARFLDYLKFYNPTAAPEPCCAGNSFLSVPISIIVNGEVEQGLLENVIITSCSCR